MNQNKTISASKLLLTYPQCDATKEDLAALLGELDEQSAWVIAQEEHKDGGKHLHAFFKFGKVRKIRYNKLASMLTLNGRTADFRFLKSTKDVASAIKYVTKEDPAPLNNGVNIDVILRGRHEKKYSCKYILETPIEELVEKDAITANQLPNIIRAQQQWKLLKPPADAETTRGIWLWGAPGTGKTTWAGRLGGTMSNVYRKSQNKWWDGYVGQEVVVLDDLDTSALCHHLKIWADKFAFNAETKGGTIYPTYKWFVVTSNYTIWEIVAMSAKDSVDEQLVEALQRRFVFLKLDEGSSHFGFSEETVAAIEARKRALETSPEPVAAVEEEDAEAPAIRGYSPSIQIDTGSGFYALPEQGVEPQELPPAKKAP